MEIPWVCSQLVRSMGDPGTLKLTADNESEGSLFGNHDLKPMVESDASSGWLASELDSSILLHTRQNFSL